MQSVSTIYELDDASKLKIKRKINRWDQTLPSRCMDMIKRIEMALQQKEGEGIFNDVRV